MNGKDLIAVLEYAKAFSKPEKSKRSWKKEKVKSFDLVDRLRQMKEEADLLEKFLKEQDKLNKKEDDKKKEENKAHQFTFYEGIILAYLAQMVIGPLFNHYLQILQVH